MKNHCSCQVCYWEFLHVTAQWEIFHTQWQVYMFQPSNLMFFSCSVFVFNHLSHYFVDPSFTAFIAILLRCVSPSIAHLKTTIGFRSWFWRGHSYMLSPKGFQCSFDCRFWNTGEFSIHLSIHPSYTWLCVWGVGGGAYFQQSSG